MIWPHQPPAQAEGNWQVHVLANAAVSSKLTRPGIDQLQQCPGSRCSEKTSVWESSEDGAHELLLQSARTENCSLWKAAKIIPRNSDCLWLVAMTLFWLTNYLGLLKANPSFLKFWLFQNLDSNSNIATQSDCTFHHSTVLNKQIVVQEQQECSIYKYNFLTVCGALIKKLLALFQCPRQIIFG